MNYKDNNSFYKSDKERFKEDMMNSEHIKNAYGCAYFGCLFPLLLLLVISIIALAIWKTKILLFLTLVSLVLIIMFQYFMKMSIRGNFDKWERNGGKL